jgi:hypothetical protein
VSSTSPSGSGNLKLCFCINGYQKTQTHDECIQCNPVYYDNIADEYECSKCAGGLYSAAKGATGSEICKPCFAAPGTREQTEGIARRVQNLKFIATF